MLRLQTSKSLKTDQFDQDEFADDPSLRATTKKIVSDAKVKFRSMRKRKICSQNKSTLDFQFTHHFPNEISMDNENIALRFEMKTPAENDDKTEVKNLLTIVKFAENTFWTIFQLWKELRQAKARELEIKKQLNEMYQQKVKFLREKNCFCWKFSFSLESNERTRWTATIRINWCRF